MKIAIIGAGGVGGYFGGALAQAGYDVTLIARGEHLAAIKANGLKVETPDGDVWNPPVNAIGSTDSIDPFDLIVVSVKGWQLEKVIPKIQQVSNEKTVVMPLLNGINAADVLHTGLTNRQVVPGLCGIIAAKKAPGVIQHIAVDPFLTFGLGKESNIPQQSLEKIKSAFEASGVKTTISVDIQLSLWQKFLFICPISAVTSVACATIGDVRSISETSELLHQCIDEVVNVGRASGVDLTNEHKSFVLKQIAEAPENGTTSMQRDIYVSTRSELETQLGTVIGLGKSIGVSTPALSFVYAALLPQELAVSATAF